MRQQKSPYRAALPQLGNEKFITDGGLETSLIYLEDWELPEFAAFVLLDSPTGAAALASYYQRYLDIARRYDTGIVLESPTWRASPGWAHKLGYTDDELARLNRLAIEQLATLREQHASAKPVVISGCLGPQDDGYAPETMLSVREAADYHAFQAATFARTAADMLCAITMTYVEEAIGVSVAAQRAGMPVAISFTVETDGRLPSGMTLAEAIDAVDEATGGYPVYYMINCAHPTHFMDALTQPGGWRTRIRGVRANASCMSHAELDQATTLDDGDPEQLGELYVSLHQHLPHLAVLGGCCGTDHRHVEAMARHCLTDAEVWSVTAG